MDLSAAYFLLALCYGRCLYYGVECGIIWSVRFLWPGNLKIGKIIWFMYLNFLEVERDEEDIEYVVGFLFSVCAGGV